MVRLSAYRSNNLFQLSCTTVYVYDACSCQRLVICEAPIGDERVVASVLVCGRQGQYSISFLSVLHQHSYDICFLAEHWVIVILIQDGNCDTSDILKRKRNHSVSITGNARNMPPQ